MTHAHAPQDGPQPRLSALRRALRALRHGLVAPRRALGLAFLYFAASAHVGTDDVFHVGNAGSYPVRVSIRQAGVIPGLADISVRVQAEGVTRVLVTALRRIGNVGQSPPPDEAVRVSGSPGLYSAQLWLMTRGPHTVTVTVEGAAGTGVLDIPVMAAASRSLPVSRNLAAILFGGGLFLVVGLLTIIGAATRESGLPPGTQPGAPERRRARVAVAGATVVTALLLFGGWTWVRASTEYAESRLDRPWTATAELAGADSASLLTFRITEPMWTMRDDTAWLRTNNRARRTDLIPDHGKIMHLFLVREPALDVLVHLHPETRDNIAFAARVPSLPAGRYRVYGDLVHEDGSTRTVLASLEAPAGGGTAGSSFSDPDDALWTGETGGATVTLADSSVMRWVNPQDAITSGTDAELVVQVADAAGNPAALEPYMGMPGHLIVSRADGQVFMHVHPAGSIPMAAIETMTQPGTHAPPHGVSSGATAGEVRFPLLLPTPGDYRFWVQIRRGGRVLTAAFEAQVR